MFKFAWRHFWMPFKQNVAFLDKKMDSNWILFCNFKQNYLHAYLSGKFCKVVTVCPKSPYSKESLKSDKLLTQSKSKMQYKKCVDKFNCIIGHNMVFIWYRISIYQIWSCSNHMKRYKLWGVKNTRQKLTCKLYYSVFLGRF